MNTEVFLLPCNKVTHLSILLSTKINISLFTNFALSLVVGITDAPPKSFAILVNDKSVCPLSTFSRQVNPCFTPSRNRGELLKQQCKAGTTLGVRSGTKAMSKRTLVSPEKLDAPGFPGAVR